MYDYSSSFAHFGSIDWRQGKTKYNVGDIVYIYCTSPIQKIRFKCIVTQLNKQFSEIRDDKEYWLNQEEYEKSSNGIFFNLKLIEEVDSEQLSLAVLLKNGLNAAPQGPVKLNPNLESYLSSVFIGANDEFFPETLNSVSDIYEGLRKQVSVNKYERSSVARKKCVEVHGFACKICKFDFEKVYGELGKEYIHVHHITPISVHDKKLF